MIAIVCGLIELGEGDERLLRLVPGDDFEPDSAVDGEDEGRGKDLDRPRGPVAGLHVEPGDQRRQGKLELQLRHPHACTEDLVSCQSLTDS